MLFINFIPATCLPVYRCLSSGPGVLYLYISVYHRVQVCLCWSYLLFTMMLMVSKSCASFYQYDMIISEVHKTVVIPVYVWSFLSEFIILRSCFTRFTVCLSLMGLWATALGTTVYVLLPADSVLPTDSVLPADSVLPVQQLIVVYR